MVFLVVDNQDAVNWHDFLESTANSTVVPRSRKVTRGTGKATGLRGKRAIKEMSASPWAADEPIEFLYLACVGGPYCPRLTPQESAGAPCCLLPAWWFPRLP